MSLASRRMPVCRSHSSLNSERLPKKLLILPSLTVIDSAVSGLSSPDSTSVRTAASARRPCSPVLRGAVSRLGILTSVVVFAAFCPVVGSAEGCGTCSEVHVEQADSPRQANKYTGKCARLDSVLDVEVRGYCRIIKWGIVGSSSCGVGICLDCTLSLLDSTVMSSLPRYAPSIVLMAK